MRRMSPLLRIMASIVILAALTFAWAAWFVSASGRSISRVLAIPTWVHATAGTVLVTYAVIRNVPGVAGLRG